MSSYKIAGNVFMLLKHRTRPNVVMGSYNERMGNDCTFCCDTILNITSLSDCIMSECAIKAFLL